MTNDLAELAERVEQATDADEALDSAIWLAVGRPNEYLVRDLKLDPPDYTSSLNAAMLLVPEGWTYEAYQGPSGQPHKWKLRTIRDGDKLYTEREGKAATAPLALCAAALRARQSGDGE